LEAEEKAGQETIELRLGSIGQFAVKVGIVTVALLIGVSYIGSTLEGAAARMGATIVSSIGVSGGADFWSRLEIILEKQADPARDISLERKEKIVANVRIIADRWRPLISGIVSAVSGEPTQK
jgi:hypothetical protein